MGRGSPGTATSFSSGSITISGGTITVTQGGAPWTFDLTRVGGSTFTLGQQLAGASLPVVLTSAQLSTLTPLTTVAVTQSTSPWVVSGTITTKTTLTASSPTAASVGTSSAQAVAANSSRKGLILTNTSINKISLGLGTTAVLNSGLTLYPGGVFEMEEYCFTTGAINAIAGGAASNLAIQEYT